MLLSVNNETLITINYHNLNRAGGENEKLRKYDTKNITLIFFIECVAEYKIALSK